MSDPLWDRIQSDRPDKTSEKALLLTPVMSKQELTRPKPGKPNSSRLSADKGHSDKSGHSGDTGQPGKFGQPGKSGQLDKSRQLGHIGHSDRSGQSTIFGQSVHPDILSRQPDVSDESQVKTFSFSS